MSRGRKLPQTQILLYARDLKRIADLERLHAHELAVATERLQRMDRLKTDFLAFISHELRTPLTPMAMVEFIDRARLDQQSGEVLDIVKDGYKRLERFVSRAVDVFHALSNDDDWTAETADICGVTCEALELLDGHATLEVEVPDRVCLVRGAAQPIAQIVRIIFDNVLKHADGQATARVSLGSTDVLAILSVEDAGKGFLPEMASEILRMFTPADVMHHTEGTALNLSLAAQLAERCGGRLAAKSDGPGRGATFALELPLAGCPTLTMS